MGSDASAAAASQSEIKFDGEIGLDAKDSKPLGETFDIGSDTRTSVDDNDYQVPFAFTGKVDKVSVQLN